MFIWSCTTSTPVIIEDSEPIDFEMANYNKAEQLYNRGSYQ